MSRALQRRLRQGELHLALPVVQVREVRRRQRGQREAAAAGPHQHALALRHDAVEGCIHRGIQPGELNQLVGADGIGRWYILSRDFKRHLNLLHALLK